MLDREGVPAGSFLEQFLKGTAVVERATDLWDEVVRDVDGDAPPIDPAIQHVTRMLFAARTSLAVVANAGVVAQAERAEGGGPEGARLVTEPALDIERRLDLGRHGGTYASTHTYLSRRN
jgi:hypothetical protein